MLEDLLKKMPGMEVGDDGTVTLNGEKIDKITEQLQALKDQIEELLEEEQDAFDNIPEAFQETDRYAEAEEKLEYLDSAFGGLEEVIENLTEATN